MNFCAKCGSLQIKSSVYCKTCIRYPRILYKRSTEHFNHYYFFKWDEFSKKLIESFKYGNHKKTLKQLSPYLEFLLPQGLPLSVYVAPNAKNIRSNDNHAYLLAKALGFKEINDIFNKVGEQKFASKLERKKIEISGPKVTTKHILVVDDVLTTGATMQAIHRHCRPAKMTVITMAYVEKLGPVD